MTRPAHTRDASNTALLHELEVHQIELEMQNEELRHAQLDLAKARDRFVDLYDFAPVGYFTLDARGIIAGANLTGAAMLGEDRATLIGRGLSRFIPASHAGIWHRHLRDTLAQEDSQRVELLLRRHDGTSFHAQVDSLRFQPAGEAAFLRITLTDITQRKLAEIDRRIADASVNAREAERRHVARELHEGLGQRLTALKMELASLPLDPKRPGGRQRVAAMLESLNEAVATVRRIAIELRPLMLDDLGLNAAIEWLVEDTAHRLGVAIGLDLTDIDPPLDERTAIACYRMVQDMLSHLSRHDVPSDVGVSTHLHGRELRLRVQYASSRHGLPDDAGDHLAAALRDRAHMLAGRVETDLAHGTCITVCLPIARPDKPPARKRSRSKEHS